MLCLARTDRGPTHAHAVGVSMFLALMRWRNVRYRKTVPTHYPWTALGRRRVRRSDASRWVGLGDIFIFICLGRVAHTAGDCSCAAAADGALACAAAAAASSCPRSRCSKLRARKVANWRHAWATRAARRHGRLRPPVTAEPSPLHLGARA